MQLGIFRNAFGHKMVDQCHHTEAQKTGYVLGPDSFAPRSLPLRQLEKPQGDAVHLWHLNFDTLTNPLSPDAKARSRDMSAAQERAIRRFYLRLLLGAYLGLPGKDVLIERRIKGRPELYKTQSRGEINFNVSRSGGSYLIGISSGAAIGVDLEDIDRKIGKPRALAKRYFSASEIEALAAYEKEDLRHAFIRTWACKEAMVKANGVGIANQLCRFSVEVDRCKPPAVLQMLDDDPAAWRLGLAEPAKNAIAAIAVRQTGIRLEGFRLV